MHRLDDRIERSILEADLSRLTAGAPPVLIDEWQRVPDSWDVVRRAVDDGAAGGQFLLTGSATPADGPTRSGAARIVTVRLRPLSLAERDLVAPTVSLGHILGGARPDVRGRSPLDLTGYAREVLRSGFPGLRRLPDRPLRAQLDSYVDRIIERIWIIEPLLAWLPTRNHISRLSSPPKHHLADPALAARLLGASEASLLAGTSVGPPVPRDGTLLGALFESLVTLCVRVYAQSAEANARHLRTRGGTHEIDLVVRRADGVAVVPAALLGP